MRNKTGKGKKEKRREVRAFYARPALGVQYSNLSSTPTRLSGRVVCAAAVTPSKQADI